MTFFLGMWSFFGMIDRAVIPRTDGRKRTPVPSPEVLSGGFTALSSHGLTWFVGVNRIVGDENGIATE